MSALSAAAHDEDGDTIARLLLENLDLRARLLECQDAVIRWATRAEKAEDRLAAPQPQREPLTDKQIYALEVWPMMTIKQVVKVIERAHGIGP